MNTRITLKNFKHAKFASEETQCFGAAVYFDGIKIGDASNDGHGGATFLYPDADKHQLVGAAEMYACSLLEERGFDPPLVQIIDQLVEQQLVRKDVASRYRRAIKTKVLFLKDGELFNCGSKGARAPVDKLIESVRTRHPTAVILNTLPEAQAIDRYVAVVMATD
jgi:hypothetical protein